MVGLYNGKIPTWVFICSDYILAIFLGIPVPLFCYTLNKAAEGLGVEVYWVYLGIVESAPQPRLSSGRGGSSAPGVLLGGPACL